MSWTKAAATVVFCYKIAGHKNVSEMTCVSRSSRGVNIENCKGLAKSRLILSRELTVPGRWVPPTCAAHIGAGQTPTLPLDKFAPGRRVATSAPRLPRKKFAPGRRVATSAPRPESASAADTSVGTSGTVAVPLARTCHRPLAWQSENERQRAGGCAPVSVPRNVSVVCPSGTSMLVTKESDRHLSTAVASVARGAHATR